MANNDYWRQRIPVIIRNNTDRMIMGDPVELQIGSEKGQAPLTGVFKLPLMGRDNTLSLVRYSVTFIFSAELSIYWKDGSKQ